MLSYTTDEQAGYPPPCNEIKLVDDEDRNFSSHTKPERGRIKIRGFNIFMGYYKDEEQTTYKIDNEGWMTTDDIGQWNSNGSLTVLGHEKGVLEPVKDQIVFNKYLEYVYMESSFVQQIFITALRFRPLVAVVVPDHEVLCWWAKEHSLQHDFRPETLCQDPRIREAVLKDLDAVADQHSLSAWEYIKAIHLEPGLFTVENKCITPTFNLRRHHLRKRFAREISMMYRQLGLPMHGHGKLKNSLTLPTFSDVRQAPYLPPELIDQSSTTMSASAPSSTATLSGVGAGVPLSSASRSGMIRNSMTTLPRGSSSRKPLHRRSASISTSPRYLQTGPIEPHSEIDADEVNIGTATEGPTCPCASPSAQAVPTASSPSSSAAIDGAEDTQPTSTSRQRFMQQLERRRLKLHPNLKPKATNVHNNMETNAAAFARSPSMPQITSSFEDL